MKLKKRMKNLSLQAKIKLSRSESASFSDDSDSLSRGFPSQEDFTAKSVPQDFDILENIRVVEDDDYMFDITDIHDDTHSSKEKKKKSKKSKQKETKNESSEEEINNEDLLVNGNIESGSQVVSEQNRKESNQSIGDKNDSQPSVEIYDGKSDSESTNSITKNGKIGQDFELVDVIVTD